MTSSLPILVVLTPALAALLARSLRRERAAARRDAACLGIGLAALLSAVARTESLAVAGALQTPLWTWLDAGSLEIALALRLSETRASIALAVCALAVIPELPLGARWHRRTAPARVSALRPALVAAALLAVTATHWVVALVALQALVVLTAPLVRTAAGGSSPGRARRIATVVTTLGAAARRTAEALHLAGELALQHLPTAIGRSTIAVLDRLVLPRREPPDATPESASSTGGESP